MTPTNAQNSTPTPDTSPGGWTLEALRLTRMTPFGPLRWLGAGVMGVAENFGDAYVVSVIEAIEPGHGDVGRYLDRLPRDAIVCVAEVLNPVLAGMLSRRGFHRATEATRLGVGADDWFRFPEEDGS